MKRFGARGRLAAAFFVCAVALAPVLAEVKLRIYMQDGSLQSGNLVAENADSFVILAKEGRVELAKKNIMFVNGKTLKQWEERPDKLFQTEIIPSEIPNPAFVNDKAALPRPPDVKAVAPATPATQAAKPAAPAQVAVVPPPTVPAVPAVLAPAPVTDSGKPAAEPKRRRKRAEPQPAAAAAPKPAETSAAPAPEAPRRLGRRSFDRAAKGVFHRDRGFTFMAAGETGRATQELLIARLLQPDNGDIQFALGTMAREQGQLELAQKYFSHWSLKKRAEAASELSEIAADLELRKKNRLHLQIQASAAGLSWLPALLLVRAWQRRRRKAAAEAPIVEADEAPAPEPAAPVVAEEPAWVAETEAAFEAHAEPEVEEQPAPPAPAEFEPIPMVLAEPDAVVAVPEPPAAALPPAPVLQPPIEQPRAEPPVEAPVEPAPRLEPVLSEEPVPAVEPTPLEPVAEEEPLPAPVVQPEPEPEPVFEAPVAPPDPEEILALARSVENALIRGNAAAAAGQVAEAIRAYRTALALNPSCASAHLGLGYVAFLEEKWETSLLHYRKALEIDPQSADAHYGAARVLLEINRLDDAVPELRATLTLDPTNDDARDALTAIGRSA